MEYEFIKMQSCGNDYLILDGFKQEVPTQAQLKDLASQVTSRHFGIGATALALLMPSTAQDLKMLCLGPDGSTTGFAPSALRCIARYAFDAGRISTETFTVQHNEDTLTVDILDSRNATFSIGPPFYGDEDRELKERPSEGYTRKIAFNNNEITYTPVFIGSPHVILYTAGANPDLDYIDSLEKSLDLSNYGSVDFVSVLGRQELTVRTWERGRGELLASEFGGCAAVVASVLNGFTDREVQVHLSGGNLLIEWSEEDNLLYCSGPADYIFTCTYYYEEGEIDED